MIVTSATALLGAFATEQQQNWVESRVIGTHAGNSKGPIAVYIGAYFPLWDDSQAIPYPMAQGQFNTITLPVPTDTNAVLLQGMLVITHPRTFSLPCVLSAAFRAPGDALPINNPQIYTTATFESGGVRAPATIVAAVRNGQTEMAYTISPPGCQSLINLSLAAYFRTGADLQEPSAQPAPNATVEISVDSHEVRGVVANGPGFARDWVAICQQGVCFDWKYLNNQKLPPAQGQNGGDVRFSVAPGSYTLRLYRNDSFDLITVSPLAVVVP